MLLQQSDRSTIRVKMSATGLMMKQTIPLSPKTSLSVDNK